MVTGESHTREQRYADLHVTLKQWGWVQEVETAAAGDVREVTVLWSRGLLPSTRLGASIEAVMEQLTGCRPRLIRASYGPKECRATWQLPA